MMAIYFSKSAGGFFIEGVAATIPDDKVEISANAWQHLISNQGPTSQISTDDTGHPVLIDPTASGKVIYTSLGVM